MYGSKEKLQNCYLFTDCVECQIMYAYVHKYHVKLVAFILATKLSFRSSVI